MPMVLCANAKLAGHLDGFRVGVAVPNNDMTAGDEDRATFFVSFTDKNGLVAQNTWTKVAVPQRRNVQEKVGTQVDHVLKSETVNKSCRVEETRS